MYHIITYLVVVRPAGTTLPLTNSATDTTIIAACLDGDKHAWHMLIQRYSQLIYSVPLRYNLSEADAGDVFQNVCVTLYRNLNALRDHQRLAAWLLTTASRESIDLINRSKRTPLQGDLVDEDDPLDIPDDAPASDDVLTQLEEEQLVRQALTHLPDRCQRLLWLLYFDPQQPSYIDIATEVGISSTAVGVNRARCLERLRRVLADFGL